MKPFMAIFSFIVFLFFCFPSFSNEPTTAEIGEFQLVELAKLNADTIATTYSLDAEAKAKFTEQLRATRLEALSALVIDAMEKGKRLATETASAE